MNKRKNKSLNRKIVSSSVSVIVSLSLVLFVLGLLSLFLINAQRLTNYVKENVVALYCTNFFYYYIGMKVHSILKLVYICNIIII